MSSRRANSAAVRRPSGEPLHSAAAATATFTTSSTSAADARATSPVGTPRAGSCTGAERPLVPATGRPETQWPMLLGGGGLPGMPPPLDSMG